MPGRQEPQDEPAADIAACTGHKDGLSFVIRVRFDVCHLSCDLQPLTAELQKRVME